MYRDDLKGRYTLSHILIGGRYTPGASMLLEGCSKFAVLLSVCNVFERGSHKEFYSDEDIILLVMFATQIIYETGQLISVDLNLRRYFHSFWNVLDCFSYVCICIWVILSKIKNYSYIAFFSLCLAPIPLSMQMLQYFSLYRPFGILVLVIKSMLQNVFLFVVVYLVFTFGFIACFLNLFGDQLHFNRPYSIILLLFQTTFYHMEYDVFEYEYEVFGKIIYTGFVILAVLFLLNLFVARIWGSYGQTYTNAHEEYAFTMVGNSTFYIY